jgi:N-acetylglutamate synthase-like GNAT family acetyltransferase
MIAIVNVKEYSEGIEKAIEYIYSKWGTRKSYDYYKDAIMHSSEPGKSLPKFFLLLKDGDIIGCYALITNDFISRHDLFPWFACLFIEEGERGNSYGEILMEHAEKETRESGYASLYLATDHEGYYERYGWRRIEDGYEIDGKRARIYEKTLE